MANRTSPEKVIEVLRPGRDYDEARSPSLTRFIRVGNIIVNQVQAAAPDFGITPMDAETAEEVETWLAAWAYKLSDQQLASTSGKTSASFRGTNVGRGLEMNNYGHAAIQMDSTGILGHLANGTVVGTAWLGKPLSELLTFAERNL